MVEPASPTAGVDIRRDYALNRRRLPASTSSANAPFSGRHAYWASPPPHPNQA
jgi:hypothetical protein